jgi:hypothetical protein
MWKHGLRSIALIEGRRQTKAEMRELRRTMRALRDEQRRVLEQVK